jgi:Ser/Thr protein kinase RdoA (MazF antagonist)
MSDINKIHSKTPVEQDAIDVLARAVSEKAIKIERFPTGSQHYVYDVLTESGRKLVVRIGTEESRGHIAGAVFWHEILEKKGLPLPKFLYYEVEKKLFEFPVIIMERLRGKDLGGVYTQLTQSQKRKLALEISNIQKVVGTLPHARGFGYARSFEDETLKQSWLGLVESQLQRTERRTIAAGVFSLEYVNKVKEMMDDNKKYLLNIRPVAFLDDTTTKNVIVDEGNLSGIVDIDFVCFGDLLYVVSLTKMALLSSGHNLDYVNYWRDDLKLTVEQEKILTLYTLAHCVGFMSELGHKFNKETSKVDQSRVENLKVIFNTLIKQYETNNY